MKKYIRTKEGNIYQRFFKGKSIRGVGGGGCCDQNLNPIGETIIKESDTIEELCDEFVFIDDFFKREHRLAYSLENAIALCKCHDVDRTTLRGAIWTDKGLIYVAKMNEKGELELL